MPVYEKVIKLEAIKLGTVYFRLDCTYTNKYTLELPKEEGVGVA